MGRLRALDAAFLYAETAAAPMHAAASHASGAPMASAQARACPSAT